MTTGFPKLSRVDINGIDVSSYVVRWSFSPQVTQSIKSIEIHLHKNVYNDLALLETAPRALSVVVRRGVSAATEDYVFRGEIVSRETLGNRVVIKASDKLYVAVRTSVSKTFDSNTDTEAGKISEIFKTLVTTYAGLNADGTSIDDSGTDIIIKTFICNNANVFERLQVLADFLDWQFYYNPETDKVHFEEKGARSGSNTLTVGSNVIKRPKWTRDGSQVVKELLLLGGPVETETTETFSGDGNETEFTLQSIPINVRITVDSTLQSGGVAGQTTSVDYYVDQANKKITFTDGSVPGSGSDNIVVDYSYLSPLALKSVNTSVTEGRNVTVRKEELRTQQDLENYASNYLARYSEDFLKADLQVTNVTDLEVGQTVTVVDSNESINQSFYVTKITKSYPYRYDTIQVDTESLQIDEWAITIQDRIRRIEEKLTGGETIVFIVKTFDRSNSIKLGRRYFRFQKQDVSGGPIWGNPSYPWGSGAWRAESDLPDPADAFVQQGADFYSENFHDEDFNDDGNTTATWDTSNNQLDFTSGEVAYSSPIDYNNGTITDATLTVTIDSGSFDLYLSADGGSNWESVSSGVAHNFSNTGTDLRWRIDENAASTGSISLITLEDYK